MSGDGQPEKGTEESWTFHGFGDQFDEHVEAHLPGYLTVQRLVADVARFFALDGGTVADLGASTGTTARLIADTLPERALRFVLYDEDDSMLEVARGRLGDAAELHVMDLTAAPLRHAEADLTLLMWVLQFIHPRHRVPLLRKAREAAAPSGALIIAAKSMHTDVRWQSVADSSLDEYKESRGVDAGTRLAKTRALRGAMIADTPQKLSAQVEEAGWSSPAVLWSWHQWVVLGAFAE